MNRRHVWFVVALGALAAGGAVSMRAQGAVQIRMATVVPQGSLWDESLQYIRQEWRRISGGAVHVTHLSGRRARRRDGDGAAGQPGPHSGRRPCHRSGCRGSTAALSCLQMPMMFDSYDELDYVRDRVAPTLEQRIEAKGFKVLNWADGGWVYTFTKTPVRTPDDLRADEAVHLGRRSRDRAALQATSGSTSCRCRLPTGDVAADGNDRRLLDACRSSRSSRSPTSSRRT